MQRPTQVAPDGLRALTLRSDLPANPSAFLVAREFAHVHHPPEGSTHLTLPQPYRDVALEKGWVLRHPFAIRGLGPPDACFVFAPRDDEELQWAKLLVEISHAWACRAIPG